MDKRIILVFIALLLLFICVGCGEQNNNGSDQQISEEKEYDSSQTTNGQAIDAKEPLDIIHVFFERYYGAYASLQSPDFTDIVEVNDDTYVFIKLLDYKIEFYRKFGDRSDIKIDVTIDSSEQQDTKILCEVYVKYEYRSHVGLMFNVELEKRDDLYMITKIQRLDTEYEEVVFSVEKVLEDNPELTYMQAVDKYFIDRTNREKNEDLQ